MYLYDALQNTLLSEHPISVYVLESEDGQNILVSTLRTKPDVFATRYIMSM